MKILDSADIVIVGAGPAGIAAALASQNLGARTILVEKSGILGGMTTAGFVPVILKLGDGNKILCPFGKIVVDRLAEWMGIEPNYNFMPIHVEALKRLYDIFITEAGVKLYLDIPAVAVEVEDGVIQSIIVSTKEGLKKIKAKFFIDSTGSGDICAWAGAPFEAGDEKGLMMAPSLCVLYANIDWQRYEEFTKETGESDNSIWYKLAKEGKTPIEDLHSPGFVKIGKTIGLGSLGHIYNTNCLREDDITRAYLEGRRIAWEFLKFYRKHIPGFENAELAQTAPLLSVREVRRIIGEYVLNYNDYINKASFPDEIGRYAYPISIHASTQDHKEQEIARKIEHKTQYKKGESYGIPYRSLIPKGLKNTLVAGMCISTDRKMQGTIRIIGACYITGRAAGLAAGLCVKSNLTDTRQVDIEELKKTINSEIGLPK